MGQTWDWLQAADQHTVIVRMTPENGPAILMVTEAGMVGGKGMNSLGLGVCLNATSIGRGATGVPLHVIYRMILNSDTVSNALDKVAHSQRAGSGTLNIGSGSGFLMSVEFTPDNFDVLMPEHDVLIHTNHYLSDLFRAQDTFKRDLTDTFVRLNRLQRLDRAKNSAYEMKDLLAFFSDHANYPDSVCSHEDPEDPPGKRLCSVYAVVMDLTERVLWVTDGSPCSGKFIELGFE